MKLSRILFRVANWLQKKYYKLSYGPRHIVGLLLLVLFLGTCWGILYGGYSGLKMCYHFATEVYHGDWNPFKSRKGDEYSEKNWTHHEFPVPEEKRHPKRMPNYSKDFNYINDVQLEAARKLGIKPAKNKEALEQMKGELVQLKDTRYYSILTLNSSSPYLVPKAADFLTAVGKLMQEYNGTKSRFYISSVLRTEEDVRKLGRINGNSTQNSTHCYGTTVDITYSRFDVKGNTHEGQLKLDLARALYDLQAMGYCYVKYEYKQPCFHITVRP